MALTDLLMHFALATQSHQLVTLLALSQQPSATYMLMRCVTIAIKQALITSSQLLLRSLQVDLYTALILYRRKVIAVTHVRVRH
jgi:N-acetylglutamate synthase-like GNAT family acetyltransferase